MNKAALFSQDFGYLQIGVASLLMAIAMAVSYLFRLRLGKDLFVASLRTTLQLIAVGYILRWLLHVNSISTNILTLVVMTLVAAQAIHSRLKEKTLKIYLLSVFALFGSVWPLGLLSVELFFGGEAFRESLFFIPYVGVLMGNALSAISLSFVGLERARKENLLEVETFKALGATPWESCQRLYTDILRNSLTPILNGMTVVGIVSLPGVMAGQLIGGVDPLIAARFQILVMFLIAFTAMMGSLVAIALNHRLLMPSWLAEKNPAQCFNFGDSEKIWLQGPSGAGKSRLLKSLVGLDIPQIKDHVHLPEGLQLVSVPGRWVAYVPQKAHFIPGDVLENLQVPFQFKKHHPRHWDADFLTKSLPLLGLSVEILKKNAMTLSGGEAQIVHLLRTLQLGPQILFLDEVTASLDPGRSALVESFLNQWLQEEPTRQIVFISHRHDQAVPFQTQTLHLEHGHLKVPARFSGSDRK